MGALADRLNNLVVSAESPDGRLTARLTGVGYPEVRLWRGSYQRYDDATLAAQLTALLVDLWAAYRRAFLDLVGEVSGQPQRDGEPYEPKLREFERERRSLAAVGKSGSGDLVLRTRGLETWQATIAPGTLRRLPEGDFLRGLDEALRATLSDYSERLRDLKDHRYGLNLPTTR